MHAHSIQTKVGVAVLTLTAGQAWLSAAVLVNFATSTSFSAGAPYSWSRSCASQKHGYRKTRTDSYLFKLPARLAS